jgi:cytochrome c-type biogenesis protein CcmH/NrfG
VISTGLLCALLLFADPAREAFESAVRSLSAGDLQAAERGFTQVLEREPKHVGALGNLGVVYMRSDRPADAVRVYTRALKLAPNDPLLHLNAALAYLRQDDHAHAKPHLVKVLAAKPDDAQARQLFATTQLFTGEVDAAVRTLEALRTRDPGAVYFLAMGYLKQGRRAEARSAMDELFATLGPAQANFLVGRAYYESTLFEDALAAFEKARQLDADLPGLLRELGKTYVSLRRNDEARTLFEDVLRRNPSDAEAQYFLGALLVQEGDLTRGVALLERARVARPDFWGSWYYLGKAHLEEDRVKEGVAALERAAELNPNESSVFYLLARALRRAGRTAEVQRAVDRFKALEAERRKGEQLGGMASPGR